MRPKIETGFIMLCAVLLGASVAAGNPKNPCTHCLGFQEVVPEVDFRSLGSVGVGTLLMVLGYTVRKGVQKIADRNRD